MIEKKGGCPRSENAIILYLRCNKKWRLPHHHQIVTDSGIFEAPFGEGAFAEGAEVVIEISKDIEKRCCRRY